MKFIIAIDGVASAGKSTTARQLAERLGFVHLNTGSMYRGVTYGLLLREAIRAEGDRLHELLDELPLDFRIIDKSLMVYYDDSMILNELRSRKVDEWVSFVAKNPIVRRFLVKNQRRLGYEHSIVCEGRDIGSVVFPEADLKVFLTCDPEERARRRMKELQHKGETREIRDVLRNLKERDREDSNREHSPLVKTEDAFVVDTTRLTIEEQVSVIEHEARRRMQAKVENE